MEWTDEAMAEFERIAAEDSITTTTGGGIPQ
jgi:hypothetical protein